jgi:hypothetical protein
MAVARRLNAEHSDRAGTQFPYVVTTGDIRMRRPHRLRKRFGGP